MSFEQRTMSAELRAEKTADGKLYIRGYAATFNTESKDLGGFREVVAPGAFTRSLKEGGDVKALFNHDANHILGRKKNGTLEVSQDEKGLAWRCELNPASQAHRDLHAAVERGDIDECSFAFTAPKGGQVWAERSTGGDTPQIVRTLTDVDLFDVSVVTYPAYPGTEAGARGNVIAPEVRSMLADFAAQRNLAAPPVETRDDDEDESWEEQISEVAAALCEAFPAPQGDANYYGPGKYWVIETHDDFVIVCEQLQGEADYYRISYAEVDEKWTFGEPVKMEKVWVEAEDGQRAAKVVAEKRALAHLAEDHQYAADYHKQKHEEHQAAATAIKAVSDRMEACSASMGSHGDEQCDCQNRMVDESDVWDGDQSDDSDIDDEGQRSVRKAERRAAFVAALEVRDGKVRTKKVGGKNLPASAFAYVGDKDKTETWKLPVHDADHTRNALARLNQTDGIPADKKAGVLRKIKAAANKFGIDAKSLDDSERSLPMSEDEVADYIRRGREAMAGIKR